jgi:hypothetical protein
MIRTPLVLGLACAVAGCAPGRTPPHGTGVARETLSREGFAWRTAEADGIHLHYLPGSYASAHAPDLARAAEAALRHDLVLAGLPPQAGPMELFLVNSREQGRQLTGHEFMGQAIPGELTAFFVAEPGKPPAFRHEIMHALSLKLWRGHRTGSWLSEAVAEWASGACQGHTVDAIASGFLRDGRLPPLTELAGRFWEIDELHAYVTGGSTVAFVARGGGASAVRALWEMHPAPGAHPLGDGGAEVEAAWRRYLATVPPARIDLGRLRQHGCETP